MTQGGAAIPVVPVTDRAVDASPALRVAVVSDGRAVEGGPARAVYVVTDNRPTLANPPVPVVLATGAQASRILAGPAQAVVVVSGSLANNMAYTNKVIALAPLAYWPLAETSGLVVTDESSNGRNGAYKAAGEPLLGQTGIGDGRQAPLFDGTNDYANTFSASLQAAFGGAEGTIAQWVRVVSAGVWADATTRRSLHFQADANNIVRLGRGTVNNQFVGGYTAGGITKTVVVTTAGPTGWVHWALSWSKAADEMKLYMGGAQQGATQTGLGVWAGSLAATTTAIGATGTSGGNPWAGYAAHTAVWNTALSAAQIATLAVVP
jgi:hypothetical protein